MLPGILQNMENHTGRTNYLDVRNQSLNSKVKYRHIEAKQIT